MLFRSLRVKWVALLSLAPILFSFLAGPIVVKLAILICLLNYLVFFGPSVIAGAKTGHEQQKRRIKVGTWKATRDEALHRCTVCKRTERDGADLEFRISARDAKLQIGPVPFRAFTNGTTVKRFILGSSPGAELDPPLLLLMAGLCPGDG